MTFKRKLFNFCHGSMAELFRQTNEPVKCYNFGDRQKMNQKLLMSDIVHTTISPAQGAVICQKQRFLLHLQGEALNRGLFFADPLPSLLGAVSGKISEIR